jgi:hypothetical protein
VITIAAAASNAACDEVQRREAERYGGSSNGRDVRSDGGSWHLKPTTRDRLPVIRRSLQVGVMTVVYRSRAVVTPAAEPDSCVFDRARSCTHHAVPDG